MGANYELDILSFLANEGFVQAMRHQIERHTFQTIIGKSIFEFMDNWFRDERRRGSTPTVEEIRERFEGVPIPDRPKHDIGTLLDLQWENYLRGQLAQAMPLIEKVRDVDPIQAFGKLQTLIKNLAASEGMNMLDMAAAGEHYMRKTYDAIKTGSGLLGLPWCWEYLNLPTQGFKTGDSLFILGKSGAGKTNVSMNIAMHFFARLNQRVAVICGHEMSREDILEIASCMVSEVSLLRFRLGKLTVVEEKQLWATMAMLTEEAEDPDEKSKFAIFETFEQGLDIVETVIETFKPDVLYVDALYSMSDQKPAKQHDLVTNFCLLGRRSKTRLIASWQQNARMAKDAKKNSARSSDQTDYSGTMAVYHKPQFAFVIDREYEDDMFIMEHRKARRMEIPPVLIRYDVGEEMKVIAQGDEVYEIVARKHAGSTTDEDREF